MQCLRAACAEGVPTRGSLKLHVSPHGGFLSKGFRKMIPSVQSRELQFSELDNTLFHGSKPMEYKEMVLEKIQRRRRTNQKWVMKWKAGGLHGFSIHGRVSQGITAGGFLRSKRGNAFNRFVRRGRGDSGRGIADAFGKLMQLQCHNWEGSGPPFFLRTPFFQKKKQTIRTRLDHCEILQ